MSSKIRPKVLCVDDEPRILEGLSLLLGMRFSVSCATSGAEGLKLLDRDRDTAVVISDMRMPGMNGAEFLAKVKELVPDTVRVLLTGESDSATAITAVNEGAIFRFLTKPIPPPALIAAVQEAIEQNQLFRTEKEQLSKLEQMVSASTRELTSANESLQLEILRRLKTEEQLVEAQKLEGLGRMAAGIAHEINNPMAFVTSNMQGLSRELAQCRPLPPSLQEYVDEVLPDTLEGIRRVNAIVAGVRRFARPALEPPVSFDLNQEVTVAVRMARCRASDAHQVDCELGEVRPISGRPAQLGQVVVNLVVNALQAMPQGGQVNVVTREEGGDAVLEVRDDGPGMSEDTRSKLFEPFFTTKPPSEGTGLGLAVCHGIVKTHGGRIEVQTAPGHGSCFRIYLPLPVTAEEPLAAPCLALPSHHETKVSAHA